MTRFRTVAACALLLVVSACSQFDVHYNYDKAADYSRLHTWAWLPLDEAAPADQRVLDRYIDARLRSAVDSDLSAKGYTQAGAGTPDFYMNYRLSRRPAEALADAGFGWWGGWAGAMYVDTDTYDEGTLYLGVIDTRAKRMIWLGAAEARLLPQISLDRRVERVDDAVHRILSRFPPG